MKTFLKCPKCGRTLAVTYPDGTIHVRLGKRDPQIFLKGDNLQVMFVCPSVMHTPEGRVQCNSRSMSGHELELSVN